MQAINKAKHQKLLAALLQLQNLLTKQREAEAARQAVAYQQELELIHTNYKRMLHELATQIAAYESLYNGVKVDFLSVKLKALKKGIPAEEPAFVLLVNNIRMAYGT